MLPFLTDQIIGATSDELSAVVRWYVWVQYSEIVLTLSTTGNFVNICVYAIPLAVIIISDIVSAVVGHQRNSLLNDSITNWLFPLLLIPLYQLLLHRFFSQL